MGLRENVTFSAVLFFLALATEVSPQHRPKIKCQLFEYYDEHMDNCGPCREICRHMEITRTQAQCKSQCSDYLTAATCTYDQYYDEMVSNCAPCSEICTHHELTRTTDQCSQKCYKYLKSLNCTEDEYFNDLDLSCSACSDLCSQLDLEGETKQECFQKCPKYVARYPPGNIINDPKRPSDKGIPAKTRGKSSSETSVHPGIIVTIITGLLAVGMTIGVVVHWMRTRRPRYNQAPSDEATVGTEEEARDEMTLQMEDITGDQQAPPPGVSNEGGQGGNGQQDTRFGGIQENDPRAPSCPSCAFVDSVV